MSKSRSKGYIYGTPYIIRGDGGSRTIGILDRFGTHWSRATARRPEPRSGDGRNLPAQRAVTFMQHCIHNATPYLFPAPGPRSGHKREREARAHGADSGRSPLWHLCNSVSTIQQPRSGAQPMREHAHNLCVYNAGAPATICRIDISRSVDLDSWIVKKYIYLLTWLLLWDILLL